MNYYRPKIGEIVIVPLAHPSGAYIRLEDNAKVPILARVRSIFSDTANVVNYFGLIYNVPMNHIEPVSLSVDNRFYLDMIHNAERIFRSLGYVPADNSSFYEDAKSPISYSFMPYLPGYQSVVYTPKMPDLYDEDDNDNNDVYDDNYNGLIHIMTFNKSSLLHVVENTNSSIMFEPKSGELIIHGYGKFLITESFTYGRAGSADKNVILKSEQNYIHIRKANISYVDFLNPKDIGRRIRYRLKMVKADRNRKTDRKYLDIMKIISKEMN